MKDDLDEIGWEIIEKHFPDADHPFYGALALLLSPPLVTWPTTESHFVKGGEDVEVAIETFRRAISEAWNSYNSLPLRVRINDGLNVREFLNLASACGAAPAYGTNSIQSPAIDALKSHAKSAKRLSAQAMAAEHPEKIALVDAARSTWFEFTGAEAPVKPSEGSAFYEFVQDVISGAGKTWGVDKTLAAWRTATEKFEG